MGTCESTEEDNQDHEIQQTIPPRTTQLSTIIPTPIQESLQKQSLNSSKSLVNKQSLKQQISQENLQANGRGKASATLQDFSFKAMQQSFPNIQQLPFLVLTVVYSRLLDTREKIAAYKALQSSLQRQGIQLITIEYSSHGSPFLVTQEFYEPYNIQVRVQDALSLKFNLVNYALKKYFLGGAVESQQQWAWVAVIDYNVSLEEKWNEAVAQELSQFQIVQMCEKLLLRDENDTILDEKISLAKNLLERQSVVQEYQDLRELSAKSLCAGGWAFRRDYFEYLKGGILDCFVAGFEEFFMCLTVVGSCSHACRNLFQQKVLAYLREREDEFASSGVRIGYAKQVLSARRITTHQKLTLLNEVAQYTDLAFENLHTSENAIFCIKNAQCSDTLRLNLNLISADYAWKNL